MKTMKKTMALLLALVFCMSLLSMATFAVDANADGIDDTTGEAVSYDYPLTVTGLTKGDTVMFYQVIEWVGETTDHSDVAGWKAVSGYESVLTKDVIQTMLVGTPAVPAVTDPETGEVTTPAVPAGKVPGGMTSEIAGKLAALATGGAAGTLNDAGTTATYNNATSGMWMALVTPTDANKIYNPVFVSADYTVETGHPASSVAVSGAYADAVAKSSTVTLTKTASTTEDTNDDQQSTTTAVGDTVNYTVSTTIPGYGNVYEHPHFTVTDKLTALKLNKDSVAVTGLTKGEAYTVAATDDGYTITFTETYLKGLKAATNVEITYSAIVTSAAQYAINEENNDVYIEYSHNPNSQSDYDMKKDTTQHYTFTLDASGMGSGENQQGKRTSELVKVGIDANGDPITTTEVTSQVTTSEKWEGPLQGAVFGLFTDSGATTPYMAKNADGTAGTTAMTATTDGDGRMSFAGLDAGTYYLKEISAPAGYVTDSHVYTVVITAQTDTVKVTEWWNGTAWVSEKPTSGTAKEVTYDTEILKSYTVTIDGKAAATYTFNNAATANSNDIVWEDATIVEKPFQFKNTKGTELPSTGGIGTKIFYTMGAVLVVGAGVVLVSRKRAGE